MSLMLAGAGLWTTWGGGCWGRIITSEVMMSLMMRGCGHNKMSLQWILGSSEGEICTLLLISDFYLSWRNPSVTISDQSVRRVTTNHLCHEELITRDSLWSLIVTPLWHHSQSPMRTVPRYHSCSVCTPLSTLTDCSFPRLLTVSKHDTSVDNLTGTRGLTGGDHCHWPISGHGAIFSIITNYMTNPVDLWRFNVNCLIKRRWMIKCSDCICYCPVWPMYETWDTGHHLVTACYPGVTRIIVLVCAA